MERTILPTELTPILPLGPYRLDRLRGELRDAAGDLVPLRRQALEVLLLLAEHTGHVVSHEQLLQRVWPGKVVTPDSLVQAVADIRRLFGADGAALVQTVARRGYLLRASQRPAAAEGPAGIGAARQCDPRADLIGREAELAALPALLAAHRLVTLVGPGGIGKTALALAVVQACRSARPDAVIDWVDLAGISDPARIVAAIAAAAGIVLSAESSPAALVEAMSDHAGLLVLDNCEQLAGPLATLGEALLDGVPGLQLMATSQVALQAADEAILPVPSLALPRPDARQSDIWAAAAVRLLVRRAQAADARFDLAEVQLPRAADLVRQLDGVPLAIEMAAARLPLLGLDGILQRLGERLQLLRHRSADAPSRHQTLRATIEWSHALLDGNEQAALRRLAVFAGPFDMDAAQDAAAFGGLDPWQALDATAGLLGKSVLAQESLDPPLYRMPVSVRLFARERLAAADEDQAARASHSRAMGRFARRMFDAWGAEPDWPARMLFAYDDLVSAFEQACRRQDAADAAEIVALLRLLDQIQGLQMNSTPRVALAHALLAIAEGRARARLLSFMASCGWVDVPGLPRAEAARLAVESWRGLPDRRALHDALALWATEATRLGDFTTADRALAEARELAALGVPPLAHVGRLVHTAWIAMLRGDAAQAMAAALEAWRLARTGGIVGIEPAAAMLAAEACWASGTLAQAIGICRAMTEGSIRSATGLQRAEAGVLLCDALLRDGRDEAALAAMAQARRKLPGLRTGDWLAVAARLACRRGHDRSAARLLGSLDRHQVSRAASDGVPLLVACSLGLSAHAGAELADRLGAAECARLRAEGEWLDDAQCLALLDEVLAPGSN